MRSKILTTLFVASLLMAWTGAGNPLDPATVDQQVNEAAQQLQKKVVDNILSGNLTSEELSKTLNETAKGLKQDAIQHLQKANISQEALEQRAKEEIAKQVSETVQQPGFGILIGISGILGCAAIIRRRRV